MAPAVKKSIEGYETSAEYETTDLRWNDSSATKIRNDLNASKQNKKLQTERKQTIRIKRRQADLQRSVTKIRNDLHASINCKRNVYKYNSSQTMKGKL